MANHRKNNKFDKSFEIKGDGVMHRPKKIHEHIAREVHETHGSDHSSEFLRPLTPAARDRVMGAKPGTSKVPGWHPTGGRSLRQIEMNVRGGMIG